MKKILLPLLCFAALAACTKSEVQYEAPGAITFSPVAQNITKSVAGVDIGGSYKSTFPTDIKLYVFANAINDEGTEWSDPYFKNALFEWTTAKDESTIDDVASGGSYAGNPTRYWPNVKTLKFAGYSDACGVTNNAEMDFTKNELTITSYTQSNIETYKEEGANDLMWFPCDGVPYSKQENEVKATMKHACAWITINVAGNTVTANNWLLKSLNVTDLIHTGKVVCGENTATWIFNDNPDKSDECYYSGETKFTKDHTNYESVATNNFIVIPQTPTELEVSYEYVSQKGASDTEEDIKLSEMKPVSLVYATEKRTDDNGDEVEVAKAWQPGVHYIYNITITTSEILIDPVVTEWDVYDGDADKDGDQPVEVPSI